MGSERPHQLTSVGELVFMAPPTLTCDGAQEHSIEFVPVLLGCACAGYNKSMLRLLAKKQELRKKWLDRTLPLFQHLRGPGTADRARRLNPERRAASGHRGGQS